MMETVGDLLARARERDGSAFEAPGRSTDYSNHAFVTATWKAANLLGHYGVHRDATVAVVVGPTDPTDDDEPGRLAGAPDPLFAVLGATLLGAGVEFQPPSAVETAALVAPADWLERYSAAPGCSRLAYGDPPDAPAVAHFERERWSQNPVAPPDEVSGEAVALRATGETQAALLERARETAEDGDIGAGDRVWLDGPLTAETLVPGVLTPLLAGATVVGGEPGDVTVRVGPGGALLSG
jgi:hypothetical protein